MPEPTTENAAPADEKPTEGAKPEPTDAEKAFEARQQTLGAKELDLKQREEKIARLGPLADKADELAPLLPQLLPLAEALKSGDPAAIARAAYGKKLNLDTLTLLANLPEVSAEVKPKPAEEIFEEKWAAKEAEKKAEETKKAEEAKTAREAAGKAKLESETTAYLVEIKAHIKTNADRYPWIAAYDSEVDHGALFVQLLNARIAETSDLTKFPNGPEVLDPDKLADMVEERYRKAFERTPFAGRPAPLERTLEDEIAEMSARAKKAQERNPNAPPMTLDERLRAELDKGDAESIQARRRHAR